MQIEQVQKIIVIRESHIFIFISNLDTEFVKWNVLKAFLYVSSTVMPIENP